MTDKQQKARATIIERVKLVHPNITDEQAWDIYVQQRYYSVPKKLRQQRASKAGKATKKRTFNDPLKASEAGKKSWENRRGASE